MAVESPHVNLFSPEIRSNRKMMDQGYENVYENDTKFGYGLVQMQSGMFPMYNPAADTGMITCNLPITRKRSRDSSSFDPSVLSFPNAQFVNQNQFNNQKGTFMFLGQDMSMQIYQQQREIDQFIAQHTENVRSEIELTRRRNVMRLIAAAEEGLKTRLRSKEDEIIKISKLNYALEEKVKSLSIENQIWQQMAQTNEATANVLRRNLQRILTDIQLNQNADKTTAAATFDDVESCCGSNSDEEHHHRRTLVEHGVGERKVNIPNQVNDVNEYCTTTSDNNGSRLNRVCRNCGKEESCVLLLPCRHLCICTVCESSINFCPICKSSKNATVHVNMS